MAKLARDAKESAQVVKEEYSHELDQLNALVANFQQADRIAHLGWRDAQAKAALDEIQDLSNSGDSPAEMKRIREAYEKQKGELAEAKKKVEDLDSDLRSTKGVLSTVQHELDTVKAKAKNKLGTDCQLRLIFGKELEGDRTLSDYNIKNLDEVLALPFACSCN